MLTKKRFGCVATVGALAALAFPASAMADQIVNSLDGSPDATVETMSLTVPTSGGTTLFVKPANGDGKNGCNLTGSTQATFAVNSSNTGVATVSPASVTFGSCDDVKPITVTPIAAGSANITLQETSNNTGASFDVTSAAFKVNVSAPANRPPEVGSITGATTVNEGSSGSYSVSASDPDGNPLTYAWSVTGGDASISGSATGSSATVDFTDGPSAVGLQVVVSDGTASVTRTLSITEDNLPPVVSLSGVSSANEGDTRTYTYTVTDPGADTPTVTSESCGGNATYTDTATANSFTCAYPDNGSYTVSVTADDGDPSDNIGSDSSAVGVHNVAPTIVNWSAVPAKTVACLGGNSVNVSFGVTDPATDVFDPITGSVNGTPYSGRSFSGSVSFPNPGPWSVTANANDGDGGSDSKTASGSFLYSTTGGFPLPPINSDGTSNFKLGSTIPVKLRVVDCLGTPVAGLAPQVALSRTSTASSGALNEEVLTVSNPDEGKTMRYDAAGGQYIYNLSTKRSVFVAGGGALELGGYTLSVGGANIAAPASVKFDILK